MRFNLVLLTPFLMPNTLHSLHFQILYIQEKSMNQTVYILILISLVVLFYLTSTKEKNYNGS